MSTGTGSQGPDVRITPEALQQLDTYVEAVDSEISGLGIVETVGEGVLVIRKLYLPVQQAGGAETEFDAEQMAKVMHEAMVAGDDPTKLRLWWHSHVRMGTFWSSQDQATAAALARQAGGWFVSIVANQKGERRTRVDMAEPFRVVWDELPLRMNIPEAPEMVERIKAEVAEKVQSRRVVVGGFTEGRGLPAPGGRYGSFVFSDGTVWDHQNREFVPVSTIPVAERPTRRIEGARRVGEDAAGDVVERMDGSDLDEYEAAAWAAAVPSLRHCDDPNCSSGPGAMYHTYEYGPTRRGGA